MSQGIITTIAENAPGLNADTGAARIAGSGNLTGLVAPGTGDVYFTEGYDHRVQKLSGGVITTVAGNGTPGYSGDNGPTLNAQLNFPLGLAVDGADNLYIVDHGNGVVRKVSNGIITTVAGPFSDPSQIAVDDAGNVYVNNGTVVDKASGGVITPIATVGWPAGLAADKAGCLYVSDSTNNRVLVFGSVLPLKPRPSRTESGRPLPLR